MVIKHVLIVSAGLLLGVSSANALTYKGVEMPDHMTVDGEKLVLNGVGVRTKKIIGFNKNIYVTGLYLKAKSDNAQAIINADETMALRIGIVTSLVTSERFTEATKTGFKESTKGNTAPIEKEIQRFMDTFTDEIDDGDVFNIVYKKGVGVQTYKNGINKPIVTIAGMPIKKALFGIWIGYRTENALQVLTKALLGKSASGQ